MQQLKTGRRGIQPQVFFFFFFRESTRLLLERLKAEHACSSSPQFPLVSNMTSFILLHHASAIRMDSEFALSYSLAIQYVLRRPTASSWNCLERQFLASPQVYSNRICSFKRYYMISMHIEVCKTLPYSIWLST